MSVCVPLAIIELYRLGRSQTDRDSLASASCVLGLKECVTTPSLVNVFEKHCSTVFKA